MTRKRQAVRTSRPDRALALILGLMVAAPVAAQETSLPIDRPSEAEIEAAEPTIAVLRALDKITARITELEIPVGGKQGFGTLTIDVQYCRSRPPIEPPESFAYLTIHDRPAGQTEEVKVFEGWMLASSPALNGLEHPVYDVWVIACKAAAPESDTGSR